MWLTEKMMERGDMHTSRRSGTLCAVILLLLGSVAVGPRSQTVAQTGPSDLSDALMLYASNERQTSDWGFEKVTRFYGLKLAELDLTTTTLTDALLRDEAGVYYPTVYVDGTTLETQLNGTELQVLEEAIDAGGITLLIGSLRMQTSQAVRELTDGEILGSTFVVDSQKDYQISEARPEVTRELTGVMITYDGEPLDYALTIGRDASHVEILVGCTDDEEEPYPLFARYQNGLGSVFVVSNYADTYLKSNLLRENYWATRSGPTYTQPWFSHLVPMMMLVRFSAGDEAWHSDHDYANLTLDDPSLRGSDFDYAGILDEAIAHNFHLTLALIPANYSNSEPSVIGLFLEDPERLSLVQHGNNHDGYEFYKYAVDEDDPHRARPLEEQEADIVEGRSRMEAHARYTGIPYAPVMIFPWNISPTETLTLLKQYNFQATINSLDYPLGTQRSRAWDSHMYPAELDYSNFAVIGRFHPDYAPYPFDLFIDRPVFLYQHKGFFNEGIGAFNRVADTINGLYGEVEWQSLDYIMKHLYLEKTNDDGSIDVMFFGNQLALTNESATQRRYHVRREETQNASIASVTVDNVPVDYSHVDNVLQVDLVIPAGTSRELGIRYAPANRDFALSPPDVVFDVATGTIRATVHNRGSEAGPVTVGFFEARAEDGAKPFALVTARRIEPGATAVVTAALQAPMQAGIKVVVDPYDVIVETVETNNSVASPSFRQYLPLVVRSASVVAALTAPVFVHGNPSPDDSELATHEVSTGGTTTGAADSLQDERLDDEIYLPTVVSSEDRTYYVSRTGSNRDGRSWATAWNELDQIHWDVIRPGDTILIDGGPTECAFPVMVTGESNSPRGASGSECGMIYQSTLTVGTSGQPGNPITIWLAEEPGRNGTARVFGGRSTPLPFCGQIGYTHQSAVVRHVGILVGAHSWVVIDGRKWSGVAIYGHSRYGIQLEADSDHVVVRNVEVYDNGSARQYGGEWEPDLPGVDFAGRHVSFERAIVHDNGQDAFQSEGGIDHFALRESWLYNSRKHATSGESFNYCTHSDGMQIYDGGPQSGVLIEESIIGPGFMQGVILGQQLTSGNAQAIVNDVTLRNVLFTKASSTSIMGYPNVKPEGWVLDHVTAHCPSPCEVVLHLGGFGHTVQDSIFHSGSIYVPDGLDDYSGNCHWNTTGFELDQFANPLFVDVDESDLFSLDNYALAPDSPCAGKGSSITSVAQLLAQPDARSTRNGSLKKHSQNEVS